MAIINNYILVVLLNTVINFLDWVKEAVSMQILGEHAKSQASWCDAMLSSNNIKGNIKPISVWEAVMESSMCL